LQNNKIFYEEKYEKNQFMKRTLKPKGARYERNKGERKAKIVDALAKADETILAVKGNKYKRLLEKRAKKGKNWI
jgi:large subunit ribosomal protein L25